MTDQERANQLSKLAHEILIFLETNRHATPTDDLYSIPLQLSRLISWRERIDVIEGAPAPPQQEEEPMPPVLYGGWPRPMEVIAWERWAGFHYQDENGVRREYEDWLKGLHIPAVRFGSFAWNEIETKPGVYDFNTEQCPLDDSLLRLKRVGIAVYLNPQPPAPPWALKVSKDPRLPAGTLVPDEAMYVAFVRALVTHCAELGVRVVLYGWGNENDAAGDPIGGLATSAFGGVWDIPARLQYNVWSAPFSKAVRSVIPDAEIAGPGTMTIGYGITMLEEEARLGDRTFDVLDFHLYAMNDKRENGWGRFPEDSLARIKGADDSLFNWFRDHDVRRGRLMIIGENGLEHLDQVDPPETPDDIIPYLNNDLVAQFDAVAFYALDRWLSDRPTGTKALTPNARYAAVRDWIDASVAKRHRAVKS